MAFIGFGKINKNLIPLVLGCIFCFLNRLVNQIDYPELFGNIILTNMFISGANLFLIIPCIISIIRSKKGKANNNKKENANNLNKIEYIYQDDKNNVKYRGLFILLIALVLFVNYNMLVYTFKISINTWILFILFASIFYYLFFKIKLYRHHYLSIIIILILGIVIDLILDNYNIPVNDYLLVLVSIVRIILLSFVYILFKYTIEKKCVSLYTIGFCNGVLILIFSIIFAILDNYFFGMYNYELFFNNFNFNKLLIILGLRSTQLGIYTTTNIINKNDSPCHVFIVYVFGQFGYYFNDFSSPVRTSMVILCLIFILFFSLVFNEIIELNFLRLSFNTKRNIVLRAENETNNTLKRENFSSSIDSESLIELPDNEIEQYN